MKKLTIFALALSATTAWAQDVPNHSVPIGRGPGVIGWGFTAACTTGNILSCNNSGNSDPTFQAFSGNLSLNNNQIYVGNVSNIGVSVPMSGDCSIIASGAITCTKTSGIAFGYFATGTSAGNLTGVLGLSQLPAFGSGDVTCGAGGSPCTVSPQAITFGKMQAMSPLSLVGVSGTAFASPGSIIGTANQIPIINNGGTLLAFTTVSGDLSNATGAFTISPLAVTNAKMATMAAYTIKGNPTGSPGAPQDYTIDGLTLKASPGSGDEMQIWDASALAWKKATVGSVGSAGSVASVGGATGSIGVDYPIAVSSVALSYVGPTWSGQLTYTGATSITFKPYNGDMIRVSGIAYQIPSAGIAGCNGTTNVTVNGTAASNLAVSTFYYVYAFLKVATLTCDFRTDGNGHQASSTAGNIGTEVRISSGTTSDNSRTLIGGVTTNSTTQFNDINTISWFNRRRKTVGVVLTSSGATPTTSIILTSWAEEAISVGFNTSVTDNTTSANVTMGNQIDSSGICTAISATMPIGTGEVALSNTCTYSPTEGSHTYNASFSANAGTATYSGFEWVEIRG